MLLAYVAAVLDRDLRTLSREIAAYGDERDLWRMAPGVPNSAGTLALHLAGNIQHYLGARLGGTAYVRDRPAEFAERGVPRAELLARVEAARAAVRAAAAAEGIPRRIFRRSSATRGSSRKTTCSTCAPTSRFISASSTTTAGS